MLSTQNGRLEQAIVVGQEHREDTGEHHEFTGVLRELEQTGPAVFLLRIGNQRNPVQLELQLVGREQHLPGSDKPRGDEGKRRDEEDAEERQNPPGHDPEDAAAVERAVPGDPVRKKLGDIQGECRGDSAENDVDADQQQSQNREVDDVLGSDDFTLLARLFKLSPRRLIRLVILVFAGVAHFAASKGIIRIIRAFSCQTVRSSSECWYRKYIENRATNGMPMKETMNCGMALLMKPMDR